MNIYEWCAESYLTHRRRIFWRIRDFDQPIVGDGPTKNFDFLVQLGDHGALLEIKGRRFPTKGGARWENWVTGDDLTALTRWSDTFGTEFSPYIVFVYHLTDPDVVPGRAWTPHQVGDDRFGMVAIGLKEFRRLCRRRSSGWGTFTIPRETFMRAVRPLAEILDVGVEAPR
jgi:hypothetical protein